MSKRASLFSAVRGRARNACGLCGRNPATGFAKIGDTRYCHGDFDPTATCYMRAQGCAACYGDAEAHGLHVCGRGE